MLNVDLAELEPNISLDIEGVENNNFMPHSNLCSTLDYYVQYLSETFI